MKSPLNLSVVWAVFVLVFAGTVANLVSSETPCGSARGILLAAETGAALPGAELTLTSKDGKDYSVRADSSGRFDFKSVVVGTYRLTTDMKAHASPEAPVVVQEGKTTTLTLDLKPLAPFINFIQNSQVCTTKENPKLRVMGFAPVKALSVKLYRVATDAAIRQWQGWLPGAFASSSRDFSKANLDAIPELTAAGDLSLPVAGRDFEGVFRQDVSLGEREPGMYLVAASAGSGRAFAVVTVTDLGLIAKISPTEILVYSVNLETGSPVPNADISLMQKSATLFVGRTDADGLLAMPLPAFQRSDSLLVAGRAGGSLAVASLYADQGGDKGPLKVYAYTDRPVYRPGHVVNYKATMRELRGDAYLVPSSKTAEVRATDGLGDLIFSGTASSNGYGSLSGSFKLPAEAIPGDYALSLAIDGKAYESYFKVLEYSKPEFEVTVQPERKRYVRGETIRATVEAKYFFGAPVESAKLEYQVTRSPSWGGFDAEAWDEDLGGSTDDNGGGEIVASGEGKTDESGRFVVTASSLLNPDSANAGTPEPSQDYDYHVEAWVTDPGRRQESGVASSLVTQGDYRLELSPEETVAMPGKPLQTEIRAVDYDGKPVSGASGELTLERVTWDGDKERTAVRQTVRWSADASGGASATLTPDGDGDFRIVASSVDRGKRAIEASTYLWVLGEDSASFAYPYQDLDVQADKKLYKEGDSAEILINTRHAPQTALLTIEGATILERRLISLKAKTTKVSVKIAPEMMPAARVSVSFFSGKQYYSGEADLRISRERKSLQVRIATDKSEYRPGEKAVYHVKTLTPDGKPVQAEVSLGVVDESIYAIAPDDAPKIGSFFYPKRLQDVQTAFSFPSVYLSGDSKEGASVTTRKYFPDTAYWNPSVVTDANGEATLAVTMPDNLTTWRATCRAATLDTRVGQATAKTTVSQPFIVRLESPRFVTQGDKVTLSAVATNQTGEALDADIGIDAKGFETAERNPRTIRIEPGKSARADWTATGFKLGPLSLRVWAKAGSYADAMESSLPVLPNGKERSVDRSGAVDSGESFSLAMPGGTIPGTQKLTIRLTPSIASAMLGSLDYLASYPYGCVEQTMSSFLPDVILSRMLKDLKIDDPNLEKRLPDMVQSGLLRLYAYQKSDGSWGWWEYDKPDPWMTAYAIFGLQEAKAAGFPVSQEALDRGVKALAGAPDYGRAPNDDVKAWMAFVLARAGQSDAAKKRLDSLVDDQGRIYRNGMGYGDRAILALALSQAGREAQGAAILADAWNRSVEGSAKSIYEGPSRNESDALLLYAATRMTPDDPRIPNLIRDLISRRRANHWDSTRDTAFVLYGLSQYLPRSGDLNPDMEAKVVVNGKVVASRRFVKADAMKPETEIILDARSLGTGPAAIRVEKTGAGRLYYAARLETTSSEGLLKPVVDESGLSIERSYRLYKPGASGSGGEEGLPAGATAQFKSGDIIDVTLILRTKRPLDYAMAEDYFPAGCEPQDRGEVAMDEWTDWWAEQVVRDQKVGFALPHLDPGVQRITYRLYARAPGEFAARPPAVYDMYRPETRGEGVAQTVIVRP